MKSRATAETPNGSKYLQQLCKHWSHRFTVEFDPASGRVEFGGDERLELHADTAELNLVVEAVDDEALVKLQDVVASHLQRFAFRESLSFDWTS